MADCVYLPSVARPAYSWQCQYRASGSGWHSFFAQVWREHHAKSEVDPSTLQSRYSSLLHPPSGVRYFRFPEWTTLSAFSAQKGADFCCYCSSKFSSRRTCSFLDARCGIHRRVGIGSQHCRQEARAAAPEETKTLVLQIHNNR